MFGLGGQPFDLRPFIDREILLKFCLGQGQNDMPRQAEVERLIDECLIAADGDRGQPDPFTRSFALKQFERGPNRGTCAGGILQLTMPRKPHDVKQR